MSPVRARSLAPFPLLTIARSDNQCAAAAPREGWAAGAKAQARYYLSGMLRGEKRPFVATPARRLNTLQQLAYIGLLYLLMPALMLSGLLFMSPEALPGRLLGMNAKLPVALIHVSLAASILLFTLGHIYLATTGPRLSSLIRTMLTGWQEIESAGERRSLASAAARSTLVLDVVRGADTASGERRANRRKKRRRARQKQSRRTSRPKAR
jgi:hypothetical protein